MFAVDPDPPQRRELARPRAVCAPRRRVHGSSAGLGGLLGLGQLDALGVVLVERVEGVAAGDEAVAGGGGAVAEGAADEPRLDRAAGEHVGGAGAGRRAPCARGRPSSPRRPRSPPARRGAATPGGTSSRSRRCTGPGGRRSARRWPRAGGRRRRAGPRAAGSRRRAGSRPAAGCAGCSTGSRRSRRRGRCRAPRCTVEQAWASVRSMPRPVPSPPKACARRPPTRRGPDPVGAGSNGPKSKADSRTAIARPGARRMPSTTAPQERRATGKIAAVPAGPVVGAQQLVEQVAVAVLHVDEVEARLLGQHGRLDVLLGQLVELVVAEHVGGPRPARAVEHRMAVGGAGRAPPRPGEPARVGELQPDHLVRGSRRPRSAARSSTVVRR